MPYENYYEEMKLRRYLRDSVEMLSELHQCDDPSYYEHVDNEVRALRTQLIEEYGEKK